MISLAEAIVTTVRKTFKQIFKIKHGLSLIMHERTEIDKSCPLRHFKIKKEKEPWITPYLIELIKDKDKDKALKTAKKIQTYI